MTETLELSSQWLDSLREVAENLGVSVDETELQAAVAPAWLLFRRKLETSSPPRVDAWQGALFRRYFVRALAVVRKRRAIEAQRKTPKELRVEVAAHIDGVIKASLQSTSWFDPRDWLELRRWSGHEPTGLLGDFVLDYCCGVTAAQELSFQQNNKTEAWAVEFFHAEAVAKKKQLRFRALPARPARPASANAGDS